MSYWILALLLAATVVWIVTVVYAIRREEGATKMAWSLVILLGYIFGAALYWITRRRPVAPPGVNTTLLLLGLLLAAAFMSHTVWAAIKEHTYSWPGHTGTANVWFTVDESECEISLMRCELTGWTSIGVYYAWIECIPDAPTEIHCRTADGKPGIQRCQNVTVLLMNAAAIPLVGEIGKWEEGRTTISDCTPCCPRSEGQ